MYQHPVRDRCYIRVPRLSCQYRWLSRPGVLIYHLTQEAAGTKQETYKQILPGYIRRKEYKMLNLTYLKPKVTYEVNFSKVSPHVVQVLGNLPFSDKGFTLSRPGKKDSWDYSAYTTLYREVENGLQFSDDESVYVAPPTPELVPEPEPYIPTLEEIKVTKKQEMENMKRAAMEAGVAVTLTDGSIEHFTLADEEQRLLMALQTNVVAGDEKIPWHTSDETEHCKYYSNADMILIITAASAYGTYHETYIRDLRIYIDSLENKDAVEAVTYGIVIPEEYRSEVLQDMYEAQQEG